MHLVKKTYFVVCFQILVLAFTSCNQSKEKIDWESPFVKSEMAWRAERDRQMKCRESWLTIAGLFWLDEGENTFGTGSGNAIVLPESSAPANAGRFILKDGQVTVVSEEDVDLRSQDKPVKRMKLNSDAGGKPDFISINDLILWVIKRGDRYAIRLRDFNAPRYVQYEKLNFYPPREKYAVKGEFVPYDEPKEMVLSTVVNTTTRVKSAGIITFRINDVACRLEGFASGPDAKNFFIIFKDETSGEETYGAARFMAAGVLEDGTVDLNFNRAYNPPCAYTPYATCPLPPLQNYLPVKIEAGEKLYSKDH